MGKILSWIFKEAVVGYVKKGIYIALILGYFIAISGMWGSLVIAWFYLFEQMQLLLNTISSSGGAGGGSIVQKLYGLLNCIGFIDAFNNTKSVWVSGMIFVMSRIMYSYTVQVYHLFLGALTPLLSGGATTGL